MVLADSLKVNTTLQFLALESNPLCPFVDINAVSAAARARMLTGPFDEDAVTSPHNGHGVNVGIESRETSGIEAIAGMFAHNFSLTSLNLWGTGLDATAGRALLEGMRPNLTLMFMEIGGNSMGRNENRDIMDQLGRNQKEHLVGSRLKAQGAGLRGQGPT